MVDRRRAAVAVVLVLAAPVCAQDEPSGPGTWPAGPERRFTFTPGLWLPRVVGDAALGGRFIDLEDELSLRDTEPTFNGELDITFDDKAMLHFDGFDFSVGDRGTFLGFASFGDVSLQPGDRYRAELEMTSLAGELGVALPWRWPESEEGRLRLSPVFAVRYVDVEQRVEEIGVAREDVSADWLGLLVGARLDVQWRPRSLPPIREVHLLASTAVGPALGGDGGMIWSLRAAATVYVTDALGLQLGFRLVHVDAEDGDYELDAGLQGLFLGVSLRF